MDIRQFLCLAAAACLALLSSAEMSPALADLTDTSGTPATVHGDPGNSGGGSIGGAAQVGTGGAGGPGDNIGLAGLLFFELPDLSAIPNITLAELTVTLTGARDNAGDEVPDNYNVDLWMLPARSTVSINKPGDYGDGDTTPATATLIMEDWWLKGVDAQVGTSKTIDVTLAVQSLYSAGTPADNYALFTLYADTNLPDFYDGTYFFEEAAENPSGPTLSITSFSTIPEPGTTGFLLAFAIPALMSVRRRRK